MKPQPMSESEIVKCLVDAGCIGTVKMTFESGPYDITRTSINADRFARAIIAARDAQWAAMIGKPVAWQTFDGEGGYEYRAHEGNEEYAADWQKRNPRHAGWVSPLYAIKETP